MAQTRFLFVSADGLIVDTAWQAAREGHAVKLHIEDRSQAKVGDGFVAKVDCWRREVDWAEVIVFDDVQGRGATARQLRQEGKAVVGGTPYTDRLEDDRSFGQRELRRAGVSTVWWGEFSSFEEAIRFVERHPNRYVIKPSGPAQKIKRLLFVGRDPEGRDVTQALESYRRTGAGNIDVFQLQRFVEGVEVAVGAFFNGRRFLSPVNVNFEHKRLFPGDLGPSTGEMGTSMFWARENRLFRRTLQRLEARLREVGYVGYIDLNCIVNADGPHPLEFTSRFGDPAICIQQEGLTTPIGELLGALAQGEDLELEAKSGFQVGVRLLVPPYPFSDAETFAAISEGREILFRSPDRQGIHIQDVRRVEDRWLITGTAGVVLVVVGSGQTMAEAAAQAYARIRNVILPDAYYRTDIGASWCRDEARLRAWGYL